MNSREVKEIIANLGDVREKVADKTVLVTGGAGFLGSWLCDILVELNANVICLDNLASGLESNVSGLRGKDN
ncbi:MAG: NAD-dependent epimerase/dehydratase family protein, partial [Halobacteriota archaeon]